MKNLFKAAVCLLLVLSFFPAFTARVSASSEDVTVYTTYLPDGSYYVTTIGELPSSSVSTMSTSQQKSGYKKSVKYDSNNKEMFSLTVTGVFTYDGKTAKATSAQYSEEIYAAGWSFSDGSAVCSGNTATAYGTFKLLWLFNAQNLSVSLSCSPTGELY